MGAELREKPILEKIVDWTKVVLPSKFLKYYPPSFVVREPGIRTIKKLFDDGKQAAVIVFHMEQVFLSGQTDEKEWKRVFKSAVTGAIPNERLISLTRYFSDTISVIVKVDEEQNSISQIEGFISSIILHVQAQIGEKTTEPIKSGYMFMNPSSYSIGESIYHAHQQALTMADKKNESEYQELVDDIQQILEKKDITLLAQPIIDVSSKRIKAWEILTRGPVGSDYESPLRLFSLARQSNLLYPLEMIVVEQAFKQILTTQTNHLVFINLTVMTIGSDRLILDIQRLLKEYPTINPRQIIFEITERESIDAVTRLGENIGHLRKQGFRIAVDDTGAGYANFNTISQVMPDIIKIDRSIIEGIDTNSVKESMLKGLLLIAKETGSLVVAEGIETEQEDHVLFKNNVDLAQGYFYAKPNTTAKMVPSVPGL